MRMNNSSTGKIARHSMSEEAKMKKVKQFKYGVTTELKHKNGKLSILTKLRAHKLRDLTKTSASMSTDHSILFQSFHSTE
jgi:hypothetical protein